ncbi:LYR motif-containing protein [Nymphaea thermarum]|nr:LYR motif-containing protein [Nymphaea thermarum]
MEKAVRAYRGVLRLVRKLPEDSRAYYAKFARENFVNYRDVEDPAALDELLRRTFSHSCWVLKKYEIDEGAASELKKICGC